MAELSINDVQRAVQDGTRNLQNDLQRINNLLQNTSQQAGRSADIELAVRSMQQSLQNMQNVMVSMRANNTTEQRIIQIQGDMQELKARFLVVERFATQMSAHIQSKYQEDHEDRQYRAA